jgi:hypothetical protein
MISHSIEWIHSKLDRQIGLAQSYTDIDSLGFIIRACRLKPYDYIFKERDNRIILHRWWFDEFGNSLVLRGKKPNIIYNDLRLDMDKIPSTDLYRGLSLDRTVKMSKLAYLIFGKDEDFHQDCCLIALLGIDNHLRSYLYLDGWMQVSPLLMGMKNLKLLAEQVGIKYFHQIKNKENSVIPCVSEQAYISCLPAGPSFNEVLRKECEMLAPFFEDK